MNNPISHASPNRQALLLTGGGLLLLLLLLVVVPAVTNSEPVAFGSENPAVGSEDNTDPVVPEEFQDWTDVEQFLTQEGSDWYADCLQTRIGISREQVSKYADFVRDGHDLRFIVKSNTSISDEEARERLDDAGVDNVEQLPIRVLNGFENTRGLPSDRCNPFGDDRSQVRVSLAIPVDDNDISKGVDQNRGVLAMCGNPWKLPPETPPAPPTGAPPVTAPPVSPPPGTGPPPTAPPVTTGPPPTVPPTTTTKPPTDFDCQQNGTGDDCPFPDVQQPPQENDTAEDNGVNTGPTPNAPEEEPPPAERPSGDPDGGSGDGGAPPPTGPTDDSDADQVTEPPPDGEDQCPLGPGNC